MGILRDLFGPSKEEIWLELCRQINGQYEYGGFWSGDKVRASVGQWVVTMDTFSRSSGKHSQTYTRIRAPYVNPACFRFEIYGAGFFSLLGEMLGLTDIRVGFEPFDSDFVIKGTHEYLVRELFSNPTMRELIEVQQKIYLSVRDDEGWFGQTFPEGVDELYFEVPGVLKDIEQLKALFALFAVTLHQLCQIGAAYENDPDLRLD